MDEIKKKDFNFFSREKKSFFESIFLKGEKSFFESIFQGKNHSLNQFFRGKIIL
jgi:hypothetical protein